MMYPDEIDQEQIDMAAGKVAMPYVLIEDFKTMGLCGDVTQIRRRAGRSRGPQQLLLVLPQ